jgi:hypothetical protein
LLSKKQKREKKTQKITPFGKDVKNLELFFTVGGNV